jgi:hypothetical protein
MLQRKIMLRFSLLLIVLTVFLGQHAHAYKSLDCFDFATEWCAYELPGESHNSCYHSVFWYCFYH